MRTVALALSLVLNFMIPWEGVIRISGLGSGVKVTGFVLAIFWLATVLITKQVRKPGVFQVVAILFLLWNALSIFWSENPNRSLAHVITWAQLILLAYIWWDLYTTRTAVLAGLQAYIFGAYVSIGSAISNFLAGKVFYDHYQRYSAGETNPDGFGFILALGIPVAWYLANSKNALRESPWLRLINYAYIPLAFFGIALSGTRTALIASIVGMLYGLVSLSRVKIWVRATILILLVVSILYFVVPRVQDLRSFERLGTTTTELTQGDLNNRTNNWKEGIDAFLEHPLLGIGTNMYPTINRWGKAAHNSFIAVLVELGAIGFVIFMGLIAVAFIETWRQPRWQALFWSSILLVWILGSSTLTWTHRKTTWLFMSLLVANAALFVPRNEAVRQEESLPFLRQGEPEIQALPQTRPSQ
jgi:O-antigen ligase